MKPLAVAVASGLVFGAGMYVLGAKTTEADARTDAPALVETVDRTFTSAPSRVAQTLDVSTRPAPRPREVAREETPVETPAAVEAQEESDRSWQKTAMIIGGSAASGAGVGAIAGGKKGAMIGAAIGGGAASIYEATRRR